jgi:RNA polymerase sigma-70 factor (ECF subfamily)
MNGVSARDPVPLDNMERTELFAQIRATLEELPQGDRDILTLRYALEYDAAKIAELLEINATAVHMRLSRARQKLADKLTAQGTTAIP